MNKILGAAILAVLTAGTAQAAPRSGAHARARIHASRSAPSLLAPPVTHGVLPVLYDQFTNAGTTGIPINDSSSSYDSYDEEGADDFVVPGPNGWTVGQFNFIGFSTDPDQQLQFSSIVNLYVRPDAAGVPAVAPSCSYPGLAVSYDNSNGVVSATLPTSCVLAPGHYWVTLQANNDPYSGMFYLWLGSSTAANSAALYRNPGDGEGTGCTDWTAVSTCWGGGANEPDPDFSFQVLGSVTTPVSLQHFDVD